MNKIIEFLFSSDIAIYNKIKQLYESYFKNLISTNNEFFVLFLLIAVCTQVYPLLPIILPKKENGNLLKQKNIIKKNINKST